MKLQTKLKGFIVLAYRDENTIFLSKLNKVYLYDLNTEALKEIYAFQQKSKFLFSNLSFKIRRLLRADIRYGLTYSESELLLVYEGSFYLLDYRKAVIKDTVDIPRGNRPLNMQFVSNEISGFTDGLYFGEYFSNRSKEEASIYRYEKSKLVKVFTFSKGAINHIHNLIPDPFQNCVWILVGDFDSGAAIYRATDGFKKVELILGNSQQYRSCVAFPTDKGLLYATDSQFEKNNIRLLYKKDESWLTEVVYPLNGPSIFGTTFQNEFVFSTSVETINEGKIVKYFRRKSGPGILKDQSEIVIGNLDNGFETCYINPKDILPFMLFQFGNILFPVGKNRTNSLCFTNVALKGNDLTTMIMK